MTTSWVVSALTVRPLGYSDVTEIGACHKMYGGTLNDSRPGRVPTVRYRTDSPVL